jgi:hypothetical protein
VRSAAFSEPRVVVVVIAPPDEPAPAPAEVLGLYPIVTLEKQLLNMIGNLV